MTPDEIAILDNALSASKRNNGQLIYMDKNEKKVSVITEVDAFQFGEVSDYRIVLPVTTQIIQKL